MLVTIGASRVNALSVEGSVNLVSRNLSCKKVCDRVSTKNKKCLRNILRNGKYAKCRS